MSLIFGQAKVIILCKENTGSPNAGKCPIFALFCIFTQCPQQYNVDFINFILTINESLCIFNYMTATIDPYRYFAHPDSPGQKQYEALRAFYVDRLPARVVAECFGYTLASFNALRHKFKTRQLTFQFTGQPGPSGSRIPKEIQQQIFDIRRTHNLSNYRIAEILAIEGHEVHPRTISRLLKEAGFPPVPRRAKCNSIAR